MSSNSKYIGLREVQGHRNEYGMGTALGEGWRRRRWHAPLGTQPLRGQGNPGGYLMGRATLPWGVTAPRDVSACLWLPGAGPTTGMTSPSSSFPTPSLHQPLPPLCQLPFPMLRNSRFWPNTCIFHQDQSQKKKTKTTTQLTKKPN